MFIAGGDGEVQPVGLVQLPEVVVAPTGDTPVAVKPARVSLARRDGDVPAGGVRRHHGQYQVAHDAVCAGLVAAEPGHDVGRHGDVVAVVTVLQGGDRSFRVRLPFVEPVEIEISGAIDGEGFPVEEVPEKLVGIRGGVGARRIPVAESRNAAFASDGPGRGVDKRLGGQVDEIADRFSDGEHR